MPYVDKVTVDNTTYDIRDTTTAEKVSDLENDLDQYETIFTGNVDESVENWLDEHPEATTTVQDHSLTYTKLVNGTLGFVTPEMFGAVGDGITVDNVALNKCFAFCVSSGIPCYGGGKTYVVDNSTASLCGHYGLVANGGITIFDCKFKLKEGCPDMTALLACKYNQKPFYIIRCDFEGELRTISSGTEDGGNHGILFCDGITMYPNDWQNYKDIHIEDCCFYNIQSYGVFPTPINNAISINNCSFKCHGPAILSYATNCTIINCDYTSLDGANTTVRALAIDEIENFDDITPVKKNIRIQNCTSNKAIFWLQQTPQRGVIYGDILIENCVSGAQTVHTYDESNYTITVDRLIIKDCTTDGLGDEAILLSRLAGAITLDNVVIKSNIIKTSLSGASVEFRNCNIDYTISLGGGSNVDFIRFLNCVFRGTFADGFVTSRWHSGNAPTANYIEISNCRTETGSRLLYGIDASYVYVNGLNAQAGTNLKILYNEESFNTDVYVDGLIMPTANSQWTYLIEKIAGKAVIRGMSAGIFTNAVAGGVTNDTTTISAS